MHFNTLWNHTGPIAECPVVGTTVEGLPKKPLGVKERTIDLSSDTSDMDLEKLAAARRAKKRPSSKPTTQSTSGKKAKVEHAGQAGGKRFILATEEDPPTEKGQKRTPPKKTPAKKSSQSKQPLPQSSSSSEEDSLPDVVINGGRKGAKKSSLQVQLASLRAEHSNVRDELLQSQKMVQHYSESMKRHTADLETLRESQEFQLSEIDRYQADQKNKGGILAKLQKEHTRLQCAVGEKAEELRTRTKRDCEEKIADAQSEVEEANERRAKAEKALAVAEKEVEMLKKENAQCYSTHSFMVKSLDAQEKMLSFCTNGRS